MDSSEAMGPRPRLSVAMIVRDEAEVLARSIESIRPIADQLVVLDTGSKDQTRRIAERLGAVVEHQPWGDDFSAARNRCLELATGDWVLWLDAGERLAPESAAELREFIDGQADAGKAYMMLVEAPPADPAGSAEQVARLRLLPQRPGLEFEGRVRETARRSVEAAGLEIDTAPGRILAHPRQTSPARKTARAHRNLSLAEREAAELGERPARLLVVVGDALSDLGFAEQGRAAYREAIGKAARGSTEMLEAYYGLLTTFDGDGSQVRQQVEVCLEALTVFSFDTQLLLAMGSYLQAQGHLELAARSFDTAVRFGQVDLETWHLSELGEVAANCLSLVRQSQGDIDEARHVLQQALERHPTSDRLIRRLLELAVRDARTEDALALIGRLGVAGQQRGPLAEAVRGACRAAAGDWTPALGHLQGAYLSGCRDPLCLRWLAVTLISNGRLAESEPVLRQWQAIEPGNVEPQRYLAAFAAQDQPAAEPKPAAGRPDQDTPARLLRVDQGSAAGGGLQLPAVEQRSSRLGGTP